MGGQYQLDFDAGLTTRYRTLMDCVRATVEQCSRQKQLIAGDLDLSPSELARKLAENPNDTRYLRAAELDDLISATGSAGHQIVHWLIEKHLEDPETRKDRAATLICQLAPLLMTAARELQD